MEAKRSRRKKLERCNWGQKWCKVLLVKHWMIMIMMMNRVVRAVFHDFKWKHFITCTKVLSYKSIGWCFVCCKRTWGTGASLPEWWTSQPVRAARWETRVITRNSWSSCIRLSTRPGQGGCARSGQGSTVCSPTPTTRNKRILYKRIIVWQIPLNVSSGVRLSQLS